MMRTVHSVLVALLAVMVTTAGCAVARAGLQRERVDLVIQGGTVLTMDADWSSFHDGFVAVRGDRIVAVGERRALAPRFLARQTIDARDKAVLPGLINGHTHAPMVLFRGIADDLDLQQWLTEYIFPAEAKNVTRQFVRWGTRLACVEMIRGGTTTFADMYYFEDEIAAVAAAAGMRGVLGQTVIDFPSPDSRTPDAALEYAARFINQYRHHPLIVPAIAPHAPYTLSTETLKKVQSFAETHDVPVLMHVAETQTEIDDVSQRFGARPVLYLQRIGLLTPRLIAAHAVHLTDEEIALLKRHQVGVVHNPQSNMKLASGIAPVPRLLRADVAVGLGTDGAASNNTLDMFEAMKTTALLHKVASADPKVVSARQALAMATINGARALHLDREIGSLQPGKRADIIVVDLNAPHQVPVYDLYSQLVYATDATDVNTVIINGRVVMSNRRLLTLDQPTIIAKAQEFRRTILQSLQAK
ncbi:MAG: amidohydrolase [Acidobacteriota bacterium]|nr:amidohydrolase [Blastocatellia bacterium]MDW8238737.1 amidohydrolase [Acidobacteriota bacterium]